MNENHPKINKEINSIVNENLKKLQDVFPSAVKDGKLDITALKEELGVFEELKKGDEKYTLNWVGKQNAVKEYQKDLTGKTLKYAKGEGVNEENTQNIYIEGDNLEVLKLLKKNYNGEIKMIYIDPPYNTGEDFIYNDNFSINKEDAEKAIGIRNEYNEKLQRNSSDADKYHSNWLNMMYPRLKIARELLTDDGVIFISIDDKEISNLKKICDEIFGEQNFIDILMVEMSNTGGMKVGAAKTGTITKNGEYILIYTRSQKYKNTERTPLYDYVPGFDTHFNLYLAEDNTILKLDQVLSENQTIIDEFERFGIEKKSIGVKKYADLFEKSEILQQFAFDNVEKIVRPRSEIPSIPKEIILEDGKWTKFNSDKREESYYLTKDKGSIIQLVPMSYNYRQTDDFKSKYGRSVIRGDYWKGFWLDMGNIAKEGGVEYKNGKKPVRLIKQLAKWAIYSNKEAIVLDFFSGSATTAHSIMQLNYEDGGKRKCIMVQLPEDLDINYEKAIGNTKKDIKKMIDLLDSIHKKHYLTEIGKERIRRAGKQIKEENPDKNIDIGFKVFKVAETNLNWEHQNLQGKDLINNYKADSSNKDKLDFTPNFTDIDVVYEIMLRQEGLPLTSKIEQLTDIGNRTYYIAKSLVICLEENITNEMVEKLSKITPADKFIFRDSAFETNISLKGETFNRLSALIDKNSSKKNAYKVEFI